MRQDRGEAFRGDVPPVQDETKSVKVMTCTEKNKDARGRGPARELLPSRSEVQWDKMGVEDRQMVGAFVDHVQETKRIVAPPVPSLRPEAPCQECFSRPSSRSMCICKSIADIRSRTLDYIVMDVYRARALAATNADLTVTEYGQGNGAQLHLV
ncbi:MAG: hypothetical protein OXG94_10820 [Bacteroidetes bacterium]|nr:hypothetical protein [Bacteroidota bacterium]